MRILVLSDSHGDRVSLFWAAEKEPTAEYIYMLGDGAYEMESLAAYYGDKKPCILVRGNCDFGSDAPAYDVRRVNGIGIYATHGYSEQVKYTYENLKSAARDAGCTVALFGHTHTPEVRYDDGMYLFNPGSIRSDSYGVVDITDGGIICINKKLV